MFMEYISYIPQVWGSIISEAVDEVGIPPTELTPPQVSLLGLCLQADLGDRPSLEFYVRSINVLMHTKNITSNP
jgi:hypothetical protein